MKEYFDMALKLDNNPIDKTNEIYEIPSDGLKSFQAVMKDMIGNLIVELSQFACCSIIRSTYRERHQMFFSQSIRRQEI